MWRPLALTLASAAGLWLYIRLVDTLLWDRLLPRTAGVRFPKLLRQVVADTGMALLLVTHDAAMAGKVAGRRVALPAA